MQNLVREFCELGFALAIVDFFGEPFLQGSERSLITACLCGSNQPEPVAKKIINRRGSGIRFFADIANAHSRFALFLDGFY
jgi:hypothetical protein